MHSYTLERDQGMAHGDIYTEHTGKEAHLTSKQKRKLCPVFKSSLESQHQLIAQGFQWYIWKDRKQTERRKFAAI